MLCNIHAFSHTEGHAVESEGCSDAVPKPFLLVEPVVSELHSTLDQRM